MWKIAWTQRGAARTRSVGTAALAASLTLLAGAGTAISAAGVGVLPGSGATQVNAVAAIAATTAAGRTPTEFGVAHSGAATYRIPLWTPPGIGAVELDLALVYASRAGSGPVGMGWSLAGLSSITRCNRTLALDGAAGGVNNTTADRYCLDGQPLKLVSGAPGAAGAVYATALETFSRVVANGAAGNGPASFTVTTKNGLIYEYGGTADARVHAGNSPTVRTWSLSRVRDRAGPGTGNSITLTYHNEAQFGAYTNGTHRIASIAYPTTATGSGPYYRVEFSYSARPANDVPTGYLAGNLVRDPYQLDTITMLAVGATTPIKSYSLTYATAPVSGRLRLASVQECGASTCLQPTTISYQNGTSGWQAMLDTGVAVSPARPPLPLELDGDGIQDILYPVDAGSGRLAWRVLFGSATGFGAPVDTGLVTATSHTIIPGAFAGNGRMQFMLQQGGSWHVAGFVNGAFAAVNTGLLPGGEYGAADFDGDGLADLMAQSGGFAPTLSVRRNVSTPAGAALSVSFAPAAQIVWTVPGTRQSMPWDNLRVADLNGDGRADIIALTFNSSARNPRFFATTLLSNGFGNAFTIGTERQIWQESMVTMGDWNADGCSDILQVRSVFLSNCAGAFVEIGTTATPATGSKLYTALPADWNSDGRTDLLYIDAATSNWFVVPSTGNGAAAPVNTGIRAPLSTLWFDLDADGDGLTDLAFRDGSNRLRLHTHAGPGTPPDLASSFTDGFGINHSPTYASIARSSHTRRTDSAFPAVDFAGPLYVVDAFTANDGSGGTYRNQYTYEGARVHLQGHGFQGFLRQRIVDTRLGLVTVDDAARDYPHTGMPVQRNVLLSNGTTPIRQWQAQLGTQSFGAGSERRLFPHTTSTSDKQFEISGALSGSLASEATRSFTFGDGYGNPTQVQSTAWDRDPYSPLFNSAWRTSVTMEYANDASANWCLGLPVNSSVTRTAPSQVPMARTSAYVVDPVACRVTQETLEPGTAGLRVTSTYGFDNCGNLASIAVVGAQPSGAALPARTTRLSYGARCQFVESLTNAAAETSTFAWRTDFGVPLRATDPNGLATRWSHDEFGRRTSETAVDGTRRTHAFQSCGTSGCWGASSFRFATFERRYGADGALVREQHVYYDAYERLRLTEYHGALGAWLHRTYDFDAAGRPVRESRPFSTAPNGHTLRTFDALGRLTSQRDHDAAGVTVGNVTLAHSGRSTTLTDALGRVHVRIRDINGQLRRVVDPAPGGTTRYDYDSQGNLNRIQDAGGAVSSGSHNVRDLRTHWTDADAGSATYSYNSLGELVAWSDAKHQSFSATYDALGRLVSRSQPEGSSTWNWGASAAARNIGRLQSKSGLGYAESRSYDDFGRIRTRRITTDQAYDYDYTYNALGAVDTLTYPASPVPTGQSGARFKIRYSYRAGSPAQIDDVSQPAARTLWQLKAVNDFDAPVQEGLARDTISRSSNYDAATQRLTGLQAGVAGAAGNRQSLAYQWDAAGNLTQRRDVNQGLTEAFTYDGLDRLTFSARNGSPNLAIGYTAAGNITYRSDVGNYVYGDAARPHAVTAAGSETLGYDANGNVASRNGLAQQWSSANLLVTVRKAGFQSQFAYGPDNQRWRQVAGYQNGTETTHYVGGLLEKEAATSTGVTYWRHYVPTPGGDTAVVSRNSNGSTTTTYLLGDHLGSTDALLDDAGSTVGRTSFTPTGSRRGDNWSSGTAPDWLAIANSTRQGYTGHEMLDNVGLVHMNGRVYDPQLARFLSADPLIGNLGDSQSVNPYAYVGNRPLNATDPTGLVADGGASLIVARFLVDTIVSSLLHGILHGGSGLPPPPATALPGRSAQSGAGPCGAGMFSSTCGGQVLYATAPSAGAGGAPTSTWSETSVDDAYAQENLDRFFADLGINAVEVLILSPVRDAQDAYAAAKRGDVTTAVMYVSFTICDVAKPCQGILAPSKALRRLGKAVDGPTPDKLGRAAGSNGTTTAVSEIRYTQAGEQFMRYESANRAFSRVTPKRGVTPGTFAAPASDGLVPVDARISTYNLPSPNIPRTNHVLLEPPPGTPVIGPRTVVGGTGNEVIFPFGF